MNLIYNLIVYLFQAYELLLVFRIILSWIPHNRNHPFVDFLSRITDPYLDLFRALPLNFGGMDFSPIAAFFVLDLLKQLVLRIF